ncbi:MAG: DnaB-like helicase C-terminal domain-containing protein [Phycisphaerae bacterium]
MASSAAGRDFYGQLTGWMADEHSPESLTGYAAEIARWSYLYDVAAGLGKIARHVGHGDAAQARGLLSDLANRTAGGQSLSVDAADGLDAFAAAIDARDDRSVKTFIGPLDSATGGLERETLTILAALPGMGKSALAWQIARNVARHGGRALYVSLEMSQIALYARAACGIAGVRWREVRAGRATPEQIAGLRTAAASLRADYAGRLFIVDRSQGARDVWNEAATLNPDIIIVDHLRLLNDRAENEVIRLGRLAAEMKFISKEFDLAMVALHQLNRGVVGREDKRPMLSDLRGSGELEDAADNVLFIHRPDYFSHDLTPDISGTDVLIKKFRDDTPDQCIELDYHMGAQWFTRRGQMP